MFDWLNVKELIGVILIEQALGTQYAAMARIEAWVNPQLRNKITKAMPSWSINKFGTAAGYIGTFCAVAFLYAALDFFLNVF